MKARPVIAPQVTAPEPSTEISSKMIGKFPVLIEDRTVIIGAIAHTYRTKSMAMQCYGRVASEKDALAFRKRFVNV